MHDVDVDDTGNTRMLVKDISLHGAREASRALRTYEWLSRTEGCEGGIYDG